ncbi:hypothetical protein [Ramlibacter rhizophilus]|uniref:hypothetical protein n=1 Tax=Ramlibacter rhizophilus TaxID=1781167 RepID=UPI0014327A39|nr:hypothetical protein [Ramlibacter rhizophilus]
MAILSIRLDPELERQLDLEVARRRTTRSRLVQEMLRASLAPQNPARLLQEARAAYELPDPATVETKTDLAANTKSLARQAVARKRGKPEPGEA